MTLKEAVIKEIEETERPSDDDIMICDLPNRGYNVGEYDGKHIGHFTEWDDAIIAIGRYMKKHQFWPSVWFVSDHGNMETINFPDEYKNITGETI